MARIWKRSNGNHVVIYRDPESGKERWASFKSQADAAASLARYEAIERGENLADNRADWTLRQWGDHWLENVARWAIKESTLAEYKTALEKHVYPILGDVPFLKVSRFQIKDLIAAKRKARLSPATVRNILAPVRAMFNGAVEDGLLGKNPAAQIGRINKAGKDDRPKEICPLTVEGAGAFLATVKKNRPHFYPLFLCAITTGMRMGELIALKGTDIDFKNGLIHVQRNISRGKVSTPKNGKSRKVDMSAELATELEALLSRRRFEALRAESLKDPEERRPNDEVVNTAMDDWLFKTPGVVTKKGEIIRETQLEPANLRKVFWRLLADAGLARVRFHDLRHTYASLLLQAGESLTYVKEQMGHSSIQITADVYGHLVPGGNRRAVDSLAARIRATRDDIAKTLQTPSAA